MHDFTNTTHEKAGNALLVINASDFMSVCFDAEDLKYLQLKKKKKCWLSEKITVNQNKAVRYID